MTRETELVAETVARSGISFGARMASALDAMSEATGAGGRGSSFKDEQKIFAVALDAVCDLLTTKMYSDEARDLFMAEAQIQFHGVHAQKADLKKWREESERCFLALASGKAEAA